ncbi:MAG: hypothetical protein ACFFBI_03730 [Promethearchaeota archaeon]
MTINKKKLRYSKKISCLGILIIILSFPIAKNILFTGIDMTNGSSKITTPRESGINIIFQDDFESYPVDTFPSGYTLTYNGAGDSYQKITNTQAASGTQSFTLTGRDSWSAVADKEIQYTSDILTLEANLMSETPSGIVEAGKDNSNIKLSFANPTAATWGRNYASLVLNNDGGIYLASTSPYVYVGDYTPFTWYNLKMVVNISDWSAKVYLNNIYMGESAITNDPAEITHIRITSAHQGITGYIDDITCSEGFASNGDSNINIATPENQTYTEPMSGYFPATYGFENEQHAAIGTEIAFLDEYYGHSPSAYTDIRVLDGPVNGHNKYLEVRDSQGGTNTWAVHHIDNPQSSGTIEFYSWANNPTSVGSLTKRHYIYFRASDDTIAFRMMIVLSSEKIQYYDGSSWQDLAYTTPEEWYHHSIMFNCEAGTNGQFTWIVSDNQGNETNRVENIEFENDINTIDEIYFVTNVGDYRGTTRYDAFGFSWDPNYQIGNNLQEGLLLSFESNVTLSRIGYSLDNQNIKTILGNTTLVMMEDGTHNIQVFGNDTLGVQYQSKLRYFTLDTGMNDNKPLLSNGSVTPFTGDQKTEFTFEVKYTDLDNNPPDAISVVINGSAFAMLKSDPYDEDYTNGCIYQYCTYLLPARYNYTYMFNCNDGKYDNSTSIYSNLKVSKTNNFSPELYNPQVSPKIGTNITNFNFTVWYHDDDNNLPNYLNITINQNTYPMYAYNPLDHNATNGILYYFITTLDFGQYSFQCNCSDGKFKNSTNWNDGPEVNPLHGVSLTLLNPINNTSIFTGIENFTWESLDESYGFINYTLQISNSSEFAVILDQTNDVEEKNGITYTLINLDLPTDIYYWRVRPSYYQFMGNWSGYHTFNLSSNYFSPKLDFGSVSPNQGDQFTLFNFTVVYFDQDNNSPFFLNVTINGESYIMEKVDSLDYEYSDGCEFQYLTTLPSAPLNYTYSFVCSDGKYSNFTSSFNNLQVISANYYVPELLNPKVTPDIGDYNTIFYFEVWYYDEDNNLPSFVNLSIDNKVFSMSKFDILDNDAADGILYYLNTTLSFGYHSFLMNCSDGKFTNSTNTINGPEVNPFLGVGAVTLLTPIDNDHIYSDWINFSWVSLDALYGAVNFTLQISDVNNFSNLLYEFNNIPENPSITRILLNIDLPTGLYYWRVRPTFEIFNGSWSSSFSFNILRNDFTPLLISHTLYPTIGNESTIFRFSVIYKDLDNNAPIFIKILINGDSYVMEKQNPYDENYIDGCIYHFLTLLPSASDPYTYSFECYDGVYYNSTLNFEGPSVSSNTPNYDRTKGLSNLDSENSLMLTLSLVIGIGAVIPSILLIEIRFRKNKLKPKTQSKLKKKIKT